MLTGSVPILPPLLLEQLADGGRLFAIVGDPPVMTARVVRRVAQAYESHDLFETLLAPLVNAMQPNRFVF